MIFLNQDKNLMALLTILYKERNKWIQMADLAAVIENRSQLHSFY